MDEINQKMADHMAAIAFAFKQGRYDEIQYYEKAYKCNCDTPKWLSIGQSHRFDFEDCEYRIKPQPKVIWVNECTTNDEFSKKWFTSEQEARSFAAADCCRIVKYVEAVE